MHGQYINPGFGLGQLGRQTKPRVNLFSLLKEGHLYHTVGEGEKDFEHEYECVGCDFSRGAR